jgi:protein required for attachment to host cells
MPTKPKKTWIVIADGMHARILHQEKRGAPLAAALDQEFVNPAMHGFDRDLKSDAPGRAFDSGSGARHSMEPRTDPKTHERQVFARRVAEVVNQAAGRRAFDRLILVAPPKMLGELRASLDRQAQERVAGELDRDLIKTPIAELPEHLASVL